MSDNGNDDGLKRIWMLFSFLKNTCTHWLHKMAGTPVIDNLSVFGKLHIRKVKEIEKVMHKLIKVLYIISFRTMERKITIMPNLLSYFRFK